MIVSLVIFILLGALAGWAAGKIMKGSGFGFLTNVILGIVGSVVGGFLFGLLNISANGTIGGIVTAIVGAVIVLYVAKLIKK